jgi:hypothetical protein
MLANNPLKQYFRRPSMYFKLPSNGKYYEAGVVNIPENHELPVYPMTAIDEMTVRTPDGLFNGAAIVDLIKSCVPNILNPWKLNSVDLDAVIIAVKAASSDGVMEIKSICPACAEDTKYDIDLMPILAGIVDVDYSQTLPVRELQIKFKALTYAETNENSLKQFEIQKTLAMISDVEDEEQKRIVMGESITKLNVLVMDIIAQTIEYIQTPETKVADRAFIVEFLNNCDKNTSNLIKEHSIMLREKNELKPISVTCPGCQNQYQQRIVMNATDFFE